jgi:hypothetical protein
MAASGKEKAQSAQNTFVDVQAWNFGSENLTSAMGEPEQPAVRKAA